MLFSVPVVPASTINDGWCRSYQWCEVLFSQVGAFKFVPSSDEEGAEGERRENGTGDGSPGQGTVLCLGFKSSVYSRKLDNSAVLKTKRLDRTQNRPLYFESQVGWLRDRHTDKWLASATVRLRRTDQQCRRWPSLSVGTEGKTQEAPPQTEVLFSTTGNKADPHVPHPVAKPTATGSKARSRRSRCRTNNSTHLLRKRTVVIKRQSFLAGRDQEVKKSRE